MEREKRYGLENEGPIHQWPISGDGLFSSYNAPLILPAVEEQVCERDRAISESEIGSFRVLLL